MATETTLLPTTPLDVEAWLRSLASPSDLLKIEESGHDAYAYLLGMAEVKIAEAHTAWLRLTPKAALVPELLDVLHRCAELLDDYSDVVDGDEGPLPNRAMSLLTDVEAAIAKAEQR